MQTSYRDYRGMQIHAVPDADKAIDANGRKLPWAYDVNSSSSLDSNREPIEKGPFGRSQRRSRSGLSRSRSKTAEPRREEDRARAEQLAAEDVVFGSLQRRAGRDAAREVLGEVDANAAGQQTIGTSGRTKEEQEATEVVLYGFGEQLQWAAIDFYERVSGGTVLEDYDRQPTDQRYDAPRSLSKTASQRNLSKAALKKKNTFAGGLHWIKVTLDSRGAAELACARSPHVIKGYLVYSEPYQGRGPGKDEAIPATNAGAQITNDTMPLTFNTSARNPLEGSPNGSSTTATSATATGQHHASGGSRTSETFVDPSTAHYIQDEPASRSTTVATQATTNTSTRLPHRRPRRISGATPAIVLPASAAMLPKQPKQSWLRAWLGTGEFIGSTVPRKDDGCFDYDRATLYWRIFHQIDAWFGTDFCGLKND